MSNSDQLQIPLFQRQNHSGSLSCSSEVDFKHEPLFAAAVASLQSSIAQSRNDATSAVRFITDCIEKLAAAYEQASVCAYAAHSLRQRSPCLRPEDILRCCSVTAATACWSNGDDEIPYPVVWGSDFEIKCSPGLREFEEYSAGSVHSIDTPCAIPGTVKRNAQSHEECGLQQQVGHHSKRIRTSSPQVDALRDVVRDANSSQECTPGIYSRDAARAPYTAAAAPASEEFDWLPGDGVIP